MSSLVLKGDPILKVTEDGTPVRILKHAVKAFLPRSSKCHRIDLNKTKQAISQVPKLRCMN